MLHDMDNEGIRPIKDVTAPKIRLGSEQSSNFSVGHWDSLSTESSIDGQEGSFTHREDNIKKSAVSAVCVAEWEILME